LLISPLNFSISITNFFAFSKSAKKSSFFAYNLVNWGTVVDINPVTRKITVNFNGINRQFDPEWLMKTNPEIKTASINKHKVAHNFHKMV
jgi:hypothetical protein